MSNSFNSAMKILCVIDSLGSGGAQRQLVNLAVGFKEKGHDVSFLVYHSINFFKEVLDENDIPVHEIIEPNYLKRLFKMRRYIRCGDYDSVLSFLEAANFICEIAGLPWRKWKLVVGERSANPAILKSFKLRAYRWFHIFADHVVANSYENFKMVRQINPLLPNKKCHVIYNIVDFENWKPAKNYAHFKNNKLRIVIAASHRYQKNLKGLVKAVNLLSPEEKNRLEIFWYGESNHDNSKFDSQQIIDKYGLNIIFSFFKPTLNIHEKVQKADAVGLFSLYEGLPNTVCEGMAAGKPVIASRVSDVPLLISNNNLLSNPLSIDSIAKSLKYLLQFTLVDLTVEGNRNRLKAASLFNKENIVSNYLNLFSK